MTSYVYVMTNVTNGKQYVGCTTKKPERRWNGHFQNARKGSMMTIHCAIRKYGEENFECRIIQECQTQDECFIAERAWIVKLNTRDPNGYNRTDGGDGAPGVHRKQSKEERLMRSAAARKRFENLHERKKMSEGKASSRKRVLQYVNDTIVEHVSMKEASRTSGVARNHIRDVCMGRRNLAGGFVWRFKNEL